jgi:hypothetical protein
MEHDLEPSATVTITLTSFGRHIVAKHYSSPEWDADPRRDGLRSQKIHMPLWEAFAVFGPHIKGSNALPVAYLSVPLPEDPLVDGLRVENTSLALDAKRRLRLLRMLGKDIGLGDLDYCSPEDVERRVEGYVEAQIPRIPTASGLWFYGDRVVEVLDIEPGSGADGLFVKLRNGRRKRVDQMNANLWLGPARVDHRIPKLEAAADNDEDIPF